MSVIWEELTGIESISTIRLLEQAMEEGTEILMLSSANFQTEKEKLETDEFTLKAVKKAIGDGMVVTIPAKNQQSGEWEGTGYIAADPETGMAGYMISGGLAGGSTEEKINLAYLANIGLSIFDMVEGIFLTSAVITSIMAGSVLAGGIALIFAGACLGIALKTYAMTLDLMWEYMEGNEKSGEKIV